MAQMEGTLVREHSSTFTAPDFSSSFTPASCTGGGQKNHAHNGEMKMVKETS